MNKTLIAKLVFACIALALVLLIVYSGLQILESTVFIEQQSSVSPRKTITRNGVDYFPRQDMDVLLVMGIDQEGVVTPCEPNMAEAVDMITLLIFDKTEESVTLLSLNRDTMLDMPALNSKGREVGTFFGQLARSHMYGTGLEDSCENTRKTVSDFLYGITIDYYIAMNMDAVAVLNDAVGGVTVTVEEDFSQVDASIPMGTVTLKGEQSLSFVQSRKGVGDQLNISRIRRQQEYMRGFVTAFREHAEQGSSFVVSAYESVLPYIVTDCSTTVLTDMLDDYRDFRLKEVVTPVGENLVGKYMEFHVDEQALDELILRLFYAPKQ